MKFALVLTLVYSGLVLAGLSHHEMWRDEVNAWMIGRDSASWAQLMDVRRYEGHPALWHILLFLVTRLTQRVEAMQFVHLLIAGSTVYLMARYFPFSRLEKVALACGYFFVFEYAVISRGYAVGVLLLVAFSVLRRRCPQRIHWPWLLLAGLCHVSVYSLILAAALGLWLLATGSQRKRMLPGVLFSAANALLSVVMTLPPPDSGYATEWFFTWNAPRFCQALSLLAAAFLPIPRLQVDFFDTHILHGWDSRVSALLSLALLALATWALTGRALRGLFVGGSLALLAFAYIKYLGYYRHLGHCYVFWILCLSLASQPPQGLKRAFFQIILAIHGMIGLGALAMDWTYPFSSSQRTAGFLRSRGLADLPVAAFPGSIVAPVGFYLGRPIYSLERGDWETFIHLDNRRSAGVPADLDRRLAGLGRRVIFISTAPVALPAAQGMKQTPLVYIPNGIVADEKYYVSLIEFTASGP